MKCHIYLQDDMMNHITVIINQLIRMDKLFNKAMDLQIWDEHIQVPCHISL